VNIRWSRDGARLSYESAIDRRLHIVELRSWSPTNDRIVFTTCKRELYVVNLDGTGLSRLAESAYAPRWAPDGTSIYFLMGNRLMRVSASGGAAQRLGMSPYYGGPFSIGPAR
jgi:Tol biopolymer transport system component